MPSSVSGTPPEELPKELSDSKIGVLGEVVGSGLTFPGLCRMLVEWALECLPATQCVLTVRHPAGPTLRFEGSTESGELKINQCDASDVVLGGYSTDPAKDQIACRLAADLTDPVHIVERQRLQTPIMHREKLFGHLSVLTIRENGFSAGEWESLQSLAGYFGFLLNYRSSMDEAKKLAVRDELTGLYNRRYLRMALEKVIPRARQERKPVSVLLLDVDHFKQFNDTWGHGVGDKVLKLLANLMQSLFRSQDVVCRYGGEEFAVLLCDHRSKSGHDHPREVLHYAERLRRAAEKLRLRSKSGEALSQITISGGIATFPWDAFTADELLQRADEALYRAKRSGRNRIFFCEPRGTSSVL